MNSKTNIKEKLELINELWSPKIIAEIHGLHLKLAKVKGEFIWHQHQNEDELFCVLKGSLTIKMKDKETIVNEGEIFIVPKGTEHQPFAAEETHILLIEPTDTLNTGNAKSDLTINEPEWI